MINPFSNQIVFFGESVPDENHYLRQLIGYSAGIGTKYYEHFNDAVKYLVTENFENDKAHIVNYLSSIILSKNKDKVIENRIASLKVLSISDLISLISTTPAQLYLK